MSPILDQFLAILGKADAVKITGEPLCDRWEPRDGGVLFLGADESMGFISNNTIDKGSFSLEGVFTCVLQGEETSVTFYQLTPMARLPQPYHLSETALDYTEWYPCYTDGEVWNGYMAAPMFTRETATLLMAELCSGSVLAQWVHDAVQIVTDGVPALYWSQIITVDGQPVQVWAIGSYGWCWYLPAEAK